MCYSTRSSEQGLHELHVKDNNGLKVTVLLLFVCTFSLWCCTIVTTRANLRVVIKSLNNITRIMVYWSIGADKYNIEAATNAIKSTVPYDCKMIIRRCIRKQNVHTILYKLLRIYFIHVN